MMAKRVTQGGAARDAGSRAGGSGQDTAKRAGAKKKAPRKKTAKKKVSRPSATNESVSGESRLAEFIAKFSPEIASLGAACVARMRVLFPAALVLVYDNHNALAVGFGPSERASEAIFSIALYPRRVNLCFLQAGRSRLRDPDGLLQGSGSVNLFMPVERTEDLDDPRVRDLMDRAIEAASTEFAGAGRGAVVIKSVSAKQRPRRVGGE